MKLRIWLFAIIIATATLARLTAEENRATPPGAPATNAQTFAVTGYHIDGNTVLPPEKFSFLTNYTGPAVDLPRLQQGLGELQLLYRNLGYATVGVTLPQQKLTNGIVLVKVVEGTLGKITVHGNRYFSSNNVRRALPGLTTNVLLNTKWFQPELDRANANPDRQIYPVIAPGLEPGTSDLTLNVKDRLPVHAHIEINDKSTPFTPFLRVDMAAQYNNVWDREHQFGLEYNFSPQSLKTESVMPRFFEEPQVASYSSFYRIPLALTSSQRETYEHMPVDFGYDQVTRQFHLPPPTGNAELIFFGSRSAADTSTELGPLTPIVDNPLANISSQFAQRQITVNDDLGGKFTLPLQEFQGVRSSFTTGLEFKRYQSRNLSTNLTYFNLYSLDQYGNPTLTASQTVPLASESSSSLFYLPLSAGWSASRPDPGGSFNFTFSQELFLSPLASPRTDFQSVAGSTQAGGNYTVVNAGLVREQNLPRNWSARIEANGQWSSEPLIGNEQFALGGTSGVRGYREGESYADDGCRLLMDLRAPPLHVGSFPLANKARLPAYARFSVFMDAGYDSLLSRPALESHSVTEWGTGAGVFYTAGEHFNARLTVAWALLSTATTRAGTAQAYFSLGLQF